MGSRKSRLKRLEIQPWSKRTTSARYPNGFFEVSLYICAHSYGSVGQLGAEGGVLGIPDNGC